MTVAPRMRRTRDLGTAVVLAALLAATGSAATGSAADTSTAPSTGAPATADPDLVAEADRQLADERAQIEAVRITDAMRAASVVDLRADASTLALDPDDATVTLQKKHEEKDRAVVTLTSDLLFEFGKATLTPKAAAAVDELAASIPQDATVHVDGYTDSVGSTATNVTLSRQRARAVAAVLADARPDLTLRTTGHGEADPVAKNTVGGQDNPAGRALNRRVELSYATD